MKKENGIEVVTVSYADDAYTEDRRIEPHKNWFDAVLFFFGLFPGFRLEITVHSTPDVVQKLAYQMFCETKRVGSTYNRCYLENTKWAGAGELQVHLNHFKTILRRTLKDELHVDMLKTAVTVVKKKAVG